jgi:hypothetical protein
MKPTSAPDVTEQPESDARGSLKRVVLPLVTPEERARCKLITAANAIADGRHVDAYMEAQSALVDIAQGKNAADAKRQNARLTDGENQR